MGGGQHGFFKRCSDNKEYRSAFKSGYKHQVDIIKRYCDIIYFLSATPTVLKENLSELDTHRNIEIVERNMIVQEVAGEYNGKYIDIYFPLLKDNIAHMDYIHFDKQTNENIARMIYEEIAFNK